MINDQWIHSQSKVFMKFLPALFSWIWWMSSKQFFAFKDFSVWPNTEKLLQKTHCPRNANLLLGTPLFCIHSPPSICEPPPPPLPSPISTNQIGAVTKLGDSMKYPQPYYGRLPHFSPRCLQNFQNVFFCLCPWNAIIINTTCRFFILFFTSLEIQAGFANMRVSMGYSCSQ